MEISRNIEKVLVKKIDILSNSKLLISPITSVNLDCSIYSKVGKSIFELGVMILNEFNRLMEDKQLLTLQSADLYEDYASALYRTAWKESDNIAHQIVTAATAEKKAAEYQKSKKSSSRKQSLKPTGKK